MVYFFLYFLKTGPLFSQSGFDPEEFIVDVVIPALLPVCMKESINFRFQFSIWNFEFVRGWVDCPVDSFVFFIPM